MKYLLALAAILSTAALATAASFPQRVHYIDHDKVAAAFVKGGRIIEDQGLIVIAQRVVGRGSEMHDNTNHVFIIMDGDAEFITGGKLVDPKATAPGQTRGEARAVVDRRVAAARRGRTRPGGAPPSAPARRRTPRPAPRSRCRG